MSLARLLDLARDEEGATSIEYALIASLVSVFIILSLFYVGEALTNTYSFIGTTVDAAIE